MIASTVGTAHSALHPIRSRTISIGTWQACIRTRSTLISTIASAPAARARRLRARAICTRICAHILPPIGRPQLHQLRQRRRQKRISIWSTVNPTARCRVRNAIDDFNAKAIDLYTIGARTKAHRSSKRVHRLFPTAIRHGAGRSDKIKQERSFPAYNAARRSPLSAVSIVTGSFIKRSSPSSVLYVRAPFASAPS